MNKIKEARKAAGLSQKYVALALGVAGPSVSNWESGKTQPTPENLKALANLFNVSVDYLLGMEETAPKSAADSAQVFQQQPPRQLYYAPDVSGSMQAMPDVHVTVTDPDGVTRQLMHESLHYTGRHPRQATQQEKLAVLERDIREALNPQRAARIAEAAKILQSMTDEEYAMALNILKAMKKKG